ncbi:hypothetical protein GC584_11180 [Corynebacterium sp. zg912]|uniref:hypothetical protein n=1 Tax=Corynebacterium sp. zg912 TaxID=2656649 RepID=UPI002151EF07|nr:hypothetical protein [Corynebacterium sp. zg912]MCR5929946.1 hypothetical protein [Corynebacterium sp. zg912]
MAISNAAKMAQADKQPRARKATKKATKKTTTKKTAAKQATTRTTKAVPLSGHEDRSATLRLYVKDKDLLKRAKIAALEDDTSLSQLWEEWAIDWLENR